jgi:hypothetical protein
VENSAFDIFEFVKISSREDVLHTPMLAGLLTPFAPHGLGKRRAWSKLIRAERGDQKERGEN